jgi:4-carboxymuconolactone decarboxylase
LVDYQDRLRSLALNDERFIESVLAGGGDDVEISRLERKTHALVRLGGLLAIGAARSSYQCQVDAAFAAGASEEEIVGTLIAITPTVGVARAVSAAPELALAVGFDVDEALENLDGEASASVDD